MAILKFCLALLACGFLVRGLLGSLWKPLMCWFFHSASREWTGERDIHSMAITKWGKCSKCGNEFAETNWVGR